MPTNKKQVRVHISFDSALKIQTWGNSHGLKLGEACSAICEAFAQNEKSIDSKLDLIIELLSKKD